MKDLTRNRNEFLERKRAVDASWFILLPFLLVYAGILWHYQIGLIPFISLLKANLVLTGCYIGLHLFIERVEMDMRHLRWLALFTFAIILLQITISIHFLGGTEAFLFYPLYLLPIIASGILFSGWYPLGGALMSSGFLAILFILESPSLGWYLVNNGLPRSVAVMLEKVSIQHYPLFGFEPAPETLFAILLTYLFVSISFALLAQSTGPLLDRLYRLTVSMERDIKGRENLFNLSLYNAPAGFIIGYRSNFRLIHVNKCVLDTFSLTEDEVRGCDIFSVMPFGADVSCFIKGKIEMREPLDSTLIPMALKDGKKAFFQVRLSFLDYPTPAGDEALFLLVISNVTEELELSNIVMNSEEAMIFADTSGKISFLNRAAADIFPDIMKGMPLRDALSAMGTFPAEVYGAVLNGKKADGKVRINDKTYFFSFSLLSDLTGVELGIFFTLKDVTNEEVFYNLSVKDELTGLYNRRYFFDMMEKEFAQAIRYPKPLSLAVMDIDFFKKVNDTYGHHAGDLILKSFAKTISTGIRNADVVARIGGEEFVIYMPFVDAKGAAKLCEKIRADVERTEMAFEGQEICVTCSIGVSGYVKGDEVGDLMARADSALYEAKKAGRNRVVIHSDFPGEAAAL